MKVLTVANRKGGAGKSTCAAHLAVEATQAGYRVLLIDLDPQKTLEGWWEKRIQEDLVLGNLAPSESLDTALKKLSDFDLCIIDTPGEVSQRSLSGIEAADLVLIPSKPTAPDLGAIGRTIGMVQDNKKEFVFVLTQCVVRSKASFHASSVLSNYGQIAPEVISSRISYTSAMGEGTTAAMYDKLAAKELKIIWRFLEEKLFGQKTREKSKYEVAA